MKKALTLLNLLLSLAIISTLAVPASAKTFTDVKDEETYKLGIEFLSDMGIVNGHPDGSYKPLDQLNRAEMLKIITEGAFKYEGDTTASGTIDAYANQKCFLDIPVTAWYAKYVCYAKARGWVVGYENGKYFRPEQKVSFVEALKMSYEAFDMEYDGTTEPWFKDLVVEASDKNYIPHTIAAFHTPLQRNQMADMVTRMVKYDMGAEELEIYLGARADVVVTYETIEKGQDLSKLDVKIINNNGGEVAVNEEIAKVRLKAVNDSSRWLEIFVVNDAKTKAQLDESDDVEFLAEYNSKFYYMNSPDQLPTEVDTIVEGFVAGGIANGNNVYTNSEHSFSLNFPTQWGPVTDSTTTTVVKVDTETNENPNDPKTYVVEMTAQNFSPKILSIKAGDTVKFINKDTMNHWPATNFHPTHTNYPGSDINNCGQTTPMFDSCKALAPNESFEFTFNSKGSWDYHDHINGNFSGTIVVQ